MIFENINEYSITKKQLKCIRRIEKNIQGVKFTGKTKEDATAFIRSHIKNSRMVEMHLPVTYSHHLCAFGA
jgi:hypothetical protein